MADGDDSPNKRQIANARPEDSSRGLFYIPRSPIAPGIGLSASQQ